MSQRPNGANPLILEEKNLENVLINGRQTMRKMNERFRRLVSSSGKRRKTDNKKKKELEKRTEEWEATKLDLICSLLCFFLLFVVVFLSSLT